MTRRAVVVVVAALAGCGGADRETFVREANQSCRDYRAELERMEGLDAWIAALETHVDELKAIDAPSEARERFDQLVRLQEDSLQSVRKFAADVEAADDFGVAEPELTASNKSAVQAAQIGEDLGLADCDRALS